MKTYAAFSYCVTPHHLLRNYLVIIIYICVWTQLLSHVWLFVTPCPVAHQAPLSTGFSRHEYWSTLPFPPPGDLPNPRNEPESLASPELAGGFFTTRITWEAPIYINIKNQKRTIIWGLIWSFEFKIRPYFCCKIIIWKDMIFHHLKTNYLKQQKKIRLWQSFWEFMLNIPFNILSHLSFWPIKLNNLSNTHNISSFPG